MRGAIDDNALVQAVRKRLLRELEAKQQMAEIHNTINNHQEGGGAGHGGLAAAMNGGPAREDPDLMNYLIDIQKTDDINPETGKTMGWKKTVRRHVEPRGK